jgi:hypothetical protein
MIVRLEAKAFLRSVAGNVAGDFERTERLLRLLARSASACRLETVEGRWARQARRSSWKVRPIALPHPYL